MGDLAHLTWTQIAIGLIAWVAVIGFACALGRTLLTLLEMWRDGDLG